MLRKLLTLLAVISGFALAAEPAVAAQSGVVSVAAARAAEDCAVATAPVLEALAAPRSRNSRTQDCIRRALPVLVPTVMLRVDRSRE